MENKKELRIVFMGTPEFSATILLSLINDNYNIVGVFTQPDKKNGRKQILQQSPVRAVAENNSIQVFTPTKLDDDAIKLLHDLNPDLIILVAYGKILPQAVLALPRLGAINVHPSILPKFRGPSPIQNALLSGEKNTGTTIMLMDTGIDTGDILRQKEITIETNETYLDLADKLADFSAKVLLGVLDDFVCKKIVPQKQNEIQASYCQLIRKSDGQINWNDSAENIYNKYRAFVAWPGIFTLWKVTDQMKRLKLNKIVLGNVFSTDHQVGEVFKIENNIFVQTKTGTILLKEVQLEGKPNISVNNFINGHKDFLGSILI